MLRRIIAGLLAAVVVLGGGIADQASAAVPTLQPLDRLTYSLGPAGVQPANQAAQTAALNPGLENWQFEFSSITGNPQRLLCLKDYTPEVSAWNPAHTAWDWGQSAGTYFHMYWDDMLGGGDNCASYDADESIKLYSYSGGTGESCTTIDIDLGRTASGNVRVRAATIWLNRTANRVDCYYNATMRQNMTTGAVGFVLGLSRTGYGETVMAVPRSTRAVIASTTYNDDYSIRAQYRDS